MIAPTGLQPGVALEVAERAGLTLQGRGDKRRLCCPFHDDRTPSAFISVSRNTFYCSVCTTDGGWTAKRFAQAIGVPWPLSLPALPLRPRGVAASPGKDQVHQYGPADAQATWSAAFERAYSDRWEKHADTVDRCVYEYVRSRHLEESWEARSFGIIASDMQLPPAVRRWAPSGYRLVAPLVDLSGEIVNVQARAIFPRSPKTLFPAGSRVSGTMFATGAGVEALRGSRKGPSVVVLGEGMTDYLALSVVCATPVMCAPGTGSAAKCLGPWVRGCAVLLAMDVDQAGDNAVDPTARRAFEFGAVRVRRLVWPRRCKDACDALAAVGVGGLGDFLDRLVQESA